MSGDFSFLKGNINTIILCSLYGRDGKSGDKYGYEIVQEIKERTENKYEIKLPTLYAYLKKLEQQDLVVSYWGTESNGGRRRYYSLTTKGRNDCEKFMAEWEYHKTVLNTLVDSSNVPIELEQKDVTPLFGDKHKRPKQIRNTKELEEQDEISRKLDELIGAKGHPIVEEIEQPEISWEEEPQIVENFEEEPIAETVREEVAATTVAEPLPTPEDNRAKFEVNQDNAEVFMHEFDQRARVVSENMSQAEPNENYQHILEKMIGDQLDAMKEYDAQGDETYKYYNEHPAALEEVAENLAKIGIRMRPYRHTATTFKSKTLIPLSSVLCKAAWMTFAVAFVYFAILMFASISANNWQPFLITIGCLLLVPVAFSVYALYDPSRKDKPRFVFGRFLIAAGTMTVIIVLLALGISILTKIELHDFSAVSVQILIPTGIAILLPVYVLAFNFLYKKY